MLTVTDHRVINYRAYAIPEKDEPAYCQHSVWIGISKVESEFIARILKAHFQCALGDKDEYDQEYLK